MKGADYISKCEPSELGADVADLLDIWQHGIYHLSNKELRRIDWSDDVCIDVNIRQSLSTVDDSKLTDLVFLAHHFALRVSINPCNFRLLKLQFTRRKREGSLCERHPTLDEAVNSFKCWMHGYGLEMVGEK